MGAMDQSNYTRILNFIELIQKKPKKDVKFFFFDKDKKFVVDGKKVKLLPIEYHKLTDKDEFYIHVNPEDKRVMYWAYDVKDYVDSQPISQEEGYMDWGKVEDCIYNFFAINIKELSESVAPYVEVSKDSTRTGGTSTYSHRDHGGSMNQGGYAGGQSGRFGHGGGYSESTSRSTTTTYAGYTGSDWNTPAYKERDTFFTKLNELIKENKTSIAIDLIDDQIGKMKTEGRFDDINTMLDRFYFDKLSIITMLEILRITNGEDAKLKNRKVFFNKVKDHLKKINVKVERQQQMLSKLEPAEQVVAPRA